MCEVFNLDCLIDEPTRLTTTSMMITSRSYNCYDREKFLSDLSAVPFHVPFIFDDVDDQVWAFHHLFNNVVSEHAPVKLAFSYSRWARPLYDTRMEASNSSQK